ncbi:hypothetical protein DPMN_136037 [Dreissena polymorpha]|uniref:Uncharacterized protein n=1 Tax=Dreissena polymorpha TaxID=45954 RepID=A0A9D4G325_DREPO|nr:hypothetical protein DPMN_136037 [Dreissena polymorpha]
MPIVVAFDWLFDPDRNSSSNRTADFTTDAFYTYRDVISDTCGNNVSYETR